MSFSSLLKQARREVGLSQVELGLRLGVSGQSVKEWEAGRSFPQFERLGDIARETGKPLAWFFLDQDGLQEVLGELDSISEALGRVRDRVRDTIPSSPPWAHYRDWGQSTLEEAAGLVAPAVLERMTEELARARWLQEQG